MRWSEAGYLSQFVLAHALRQVSVSLILGVRQNMKRPKDAPLLLAEISAQISTLDRYSDVLALGYLSEIYHIAATYGLGEISVSARPGAS
jgi:hypothetical protein